VSNQNDTLDVRQVAENLILSLWGESDKLRHQAEGVRLFLTKLITENEKLLNEQRQEQSSDTGSSQTKEEQAK
jgi:hypothetical protein